MSLSSLWFRNISILIYLVAECTSIRMAFGYFNTNIMITTVFVDECFHLRNLISTMGLTIQFHARITNAEVEGIDLKWKNHFWQLKIVLKRSKLIHFVFVCETPWHRIDNGNVEHVGISDVNCFCFCLKKLRFSTIVLIMFASQTLPMEAVFACLRYLCFCLALSENNPIKSKAMCNNVISLHQFNRRRVHLKTHYSLCTAVPWRSLWIETNQIDTDPFITLCVGFFCIRSRSFDF